MSFSSEVKAELARQNDSKRHCQLAELAALETLAPDHTHLAEKRTALAKKLFGVLTPEELHARIAEQMMQHREQLLKRSCCKRAFLRGAFLASGSISDPENPIILRLSVRIRSRQRCYRSCSNRLNWMRRLYNGKNIILHI